MNKKQDLVILNARDLGLYVITVNIPYPNITYYIICIVVYIYKYVNSYSLFFPWKELFFKIMSLLLDWA